MKEAFGLTEKEFRQYQISQKMPPSLSNRLKVKPGRGSLASTHPQNICNRTSAGAGVQLELSSGLRSSFFEDWHHQQGRRNTTPAFDRFVDDLRSILR